MSPRAVELMLDMSATTIVVVPNLSVRLSDLRTNVDQMIIADALYSFYSSEISLHFLHALVSKTCFSRLRQGMNEKNAFLGVLENDYITPIMAQPWLCLYENRQKLDLNSIEFLVLVVSFCADTLILDATFCEALNFTSHRIYNPWFRYFSS